MVNYVLVKRLLCLLMSPNNLKQDLPVFLFMLKIQDEAYKKAMEAGAASLMRPTQQPYGYTCGFHDLFGNDWWPVQAEK